MLTILPAPRGGHPTGYRPADQEGAGQVRVDEPVPVLVREVDERGPVLGADVVDQDVQCPDLLLDRGDPTLDGVRVGDVEGHGVDCSACARSQLRARRLQALLVVAVQHNGAPCLDQALRQSATDPAARPGHQRRAPGNVEARVHHAITCVRQPSAMSRYDPR
jgi:hypothetical protein